MRYVSMTGTGGPEVLQLDEMEAPQPAAGEVVIRVAFAGVNRPDVLQRQGGYPAPPGASPVLGLEVSGQVCAVGAGVTAFSVGDRVCALTNGGGYAEQVAVAASQCLPVPEGLSLQQAAAIPETFFTVWSNVFERGRLQPGETLLIHGGASGIGTTAIQMARVMGARVIVTASSRTKCDACSELGADLAINYSTHDFVEEVKSFTDGRGADVILDMVGGDYIARNLKTAAVEGRIINIAYLRGSKVEINLMPVMLKRLTLTGSTLRSQSLQAKAAIAAALQQQIWPKLAAGELAPCMAGVFPLQRVADAHRLMESHDLIGKLVLEMPVAG
ncbi:NAD(P)H-quinone oxidoreductase [Pseudomaricurvus sp. HS19]|uniref:NAD(P)H-quinone oxidoreductase n=1 Tax=Pseudomaricurvus sp. HS19 TaxID=2692626 RepID=UPI00136868E1|nr:NAD(P)H-quinone oxidoreductase [Pseudomaricurvus sp. HS19]MYM63081.1 zinc-binding dehydrogenase [Pseudomaricurvus sp. HS19]